MRMGPSRATVALAASLVCVLPFCSPDDARADDPFRVDFTGQRRPFVAPVGCFSGLVPRNVMVGPSAARPCDYSTVDGYAITFDLLGPAHPGGPVIPGTGESLPRVGEVFESDIQLPNGTNARARIRALRVLSPAAWLHIEPRAGVPLPRGIRSFGGVMRVESSELAVVFWVRNGRGETSSAWVENGRVVAVRPGIVLGIGDGLWRWSTNAVDAPTRYDCETDRVGRDLVGMGSATRATLTRLDRPGQVVVVEPALRTAERSADFRHTVALDGSLGPVLFLTERSWHFECGAHGDEEVAFHAWDAERRATVAFSAELRRSDPRLLRRARAAFRELAETGDVYEPPVVPTRVAPMFSPEGNVWFEHEFAARTCYACSDGVWSSFTRSVRVRTFSVPRGVARVATMIDGPLRDAVRGSDRGNMRGASIAPLHLRARFFALPCAGAIATSARP